MAEASATLPDARGWTERLYSSFELSPASVGLAFGGLLVLLFLGSEVALGRYELLRGSEDPLASLSDARIAVFHCMVLAYLPTAYVYLIRGSRRALADLVPLLSISPSEFSRLSRAVGVYSGWGPTVAGMLGVGVAVLVTIQTTPQPATYAPSLWSLEVWWHRVLSPLMAWWAARCIYAVLTESNRLSRIASRLTTIDLLDPRPLAPFTRRGLANALVLVGAASITSLFLIETHLAILLTRVWIVTAAVALASLLLPLRGVHRRIREAKQAELDWCRDAIHRSRVALGEGARDPGRTPMDELVAYRQLIEGVREWPFERSTYLRFSLYLMIPIGSWAGGALVERLIDSLLG